MKATFISIIILCLPFISLSQSVSSSIISSAGGKATSDQGVTLDWTMGEIFSPTMKNDFHVTSGFQQGNLSKKAPSTSKELIQPEVFQNDSSNIDLEVEVVKMEVTVFPNPTAERLWVKYNGEDITPCQINIFNINGKKVFSQVVELGENQKREINHIQNLPANQYLLQLKINEKIITKKFTKI